MTASSLGEARRGKLSGTEVITAVCREKTPGVMNVNIGKKRLKVSDDHVSIADKNQV